MTPLTIVWAALICLAVTLVSPLLWVPQLTAWGVVDVPNSRSSHTVTTVRGAGLAPLSGVVAGGILAAVLLGGRDAAPLLLALGAAVLLAGLGLVEDVSGLPVLVRAVGQLVLGLAASLALVVVADASWWWALPGAVGIAAYTNAANFMDGVDGMSALHGLVAGTYLGVAGVLLDAPALTALGALTAAAFLGFAPWNLLRGRVFLGDVGSYLLGALVALGAIGVLLADGPLLLAVAPALPYLADTGSTLFGRARRGERLWEPHRGHVYQRLTDRGWSHRGSAVLVGLASLLCCGVALWARKGAEAGPVAVVVLVLLGYLSAPRWPAARPRWARVRPLP